jgi:hypothetical protein
MDSYNTPAGRRPHAVLVEQAPPHNTEIEAAVLGMIVHSPHEVAKDIERLGINNKSFYDLRHQALFGVIRAVLREGKLPDMVTLGKRIQDEGKAEAIGGLSHLAALPDMTTVPFEQFVNQLHELRRRRFVISQATLLHACAHDPKQSLDEIAINLERVIEYQRQTSVAGLTMRKPSEILAMTFDEKDCYVGDRLIAAGQSTTILGPGGIGKSRLLLQLAASCIVGRDFLGLPTYAQGKRWLILQAENSSRRLCTDLEHLRKWLGDEAYKIVDENLTLHTLETEEDCILSLDAPATVAAMKQAIMKYEPDIIAIDALYNFASGDLNSDSEMRKTLQCLSRIARTDNPQRAMVVLHHALTGKAGVGKAVGFERASYGRNSKVLHAWTRAQINIALGSPEDNGSLIVSCGKNNNGKEFKRFAARLDTDRMIYEVDEHFDWDAWQEQLQDPKAVVTSLVEPQHVRELCATPQPKAELVKALMGKTGCIRSSAYRYIQRAEETGQIRFNEADQMYLAC